MSFTLKVTPVSSTNCVDVRWSSSEPSSLSTCLLGGQPQESYFYLVNAAPNDTASEHQWIIVVRNSKTSALRLDLEHSGTVGTPLITVKRCCVTGSVLRDEKWRVTQADGSGACNQLTSLFRRFSVTPETPLGDNFVSCVATGCYLSSCTVPR